MKALKMNKNVSLQQYLMKFANNAHVNLYIDISNVKCNSSINSSKRNYTSQDEHFLLNFILTTASPAKSPILFIEDISDPSPRLPKRFIPQE